MPIDFSMNIQQRGLVVEAVVLNEGGLVEGFNDANSLTHWTVFEPFNGLQLEVH